MNKFDIAVCGGGVSGLCAAAVAARMGARVAVIEEDEAIGGAPVDHMINLFCGTPVQGILLETVRRMQALAPVMKSVNAFYPAAYSLAWKEILRGLPVSIFARRHIDAVAAENGRILSVRAGSEEFFADTFIDATGNGDVAFLAGCPMAYGREAKSEYGERFAPERADKLVQQCTLMYSVRRKPDCTHTEPADWAAYDKDTYLIWGPTIAVQDTTDPAALAQAHEEMLEKLAAETERWDKKGFTVERIAPRLGVRESRRLQGEYVLNERDIMAKTEFADSIAVVNYSIDPWDPDGNPLHRGENVATPYYQIPYRALLCKSMRNLLVSGRCISATHVANSSCRVMVIAAATGHAAGAAAALAAGNVLSVDTDRLRALLKEQGMQVDFRQ